MSLPLGAAKSTDRLGQACSRQRLTSWTYTAFSLSMAPRFWAFVPCPLSEQSMRLLKHKQNLIKTLDSISFIFLVLKKTKEYVPCAPGLLKPCALSFAGRFCCWNWEFNGGSFGPLHSGEHTGFLSARTYNSLCIVWSGRQACYMPKGTAKYAG